MLLNPVFIFEQTRDTAFHVLEGLGSGQCATRPGDPDEIEREVEIVRYISMNEFNAAFARMTFFDFTISNECYTDDQAEAALELGEIAVRNYRISVVFASMIVDAFVSEKTFWEV